MIRKSYYFLVFIICISCSSENINDCFQASGSIMETTFPVSGFTQIQIEGEVSLVVKQGAVQEVVIQTGENLLSDVYVNVEGEILVIRDENTCNLVRDYGITKAFVTTPNINAKEF
jgi:RNase P/RNase MRP subunit p29